MDCASNCFPCQHVPAFGTTGPCRKVSVTLFAQRPLEASPTRLAHTILDRSRISYLSYFPSQQKLEQKNKMKCVAKITVFLMAMNALEASRLGSPPSEVSDYYSSPGVLWTCCVVVVTVVDVVLFQPSSNPTADLPTVLPTSDAVTNTSLLSLFHVGCFQQSPRCQEAADRRTRYPF